ncbi:hypothetical protein [Streptomyces sp. NPDC052015]|uniref:hypothetical protein n=1 Tax=Streptomyces sp. NPDC052015 TaxID=3154755 RepID=UPI00343C4B53
MTPDEVEEALRGVAEREFWTGGAAGSSGSVVFVLPDAAPMAPSSVVSTYYDTSGLLACVAIDARNGPQVVLDGMRLVGRVPSEMEDEFIDYLEARDRMVTYNQHGDFSCNVLGVVVRAQRVDDVVLSRPVFVSREWTGRCGDVSEGPVPQSEWQVP